LLMWRHSTLYDGIRHVLFVIPMLGLLAGGALVRLASFLSRPWIVAGICAAAVYVTGNALPGAGAVHHINSDIADPYSITLSARASNASGTVTPSAFAVLRLITSSNLVGCTTGKSAGFSPFRILPV
jgi:hypothetical protein